MLEWMICVIRWMIIYIQINWIQFWIWWMQVIPIPISWRDIVLSWMRFCQMVQLSRGWLMLMLWRDEWARILRKIYTRIMDISINLLIMQLISWLRNFQCFRISENRWLLVFLTSWARILAQLLKLTTMFSIALFNPLWTI